MAVLKAPGRRGAAGLILALALAASGRLAAEPEPSREYQVKAAFLYNFTRFVAWPERDFAGADAALQIGILGQDPFGPALDAMVRGETVRHRRLEVKRSDRAEDLKGCQLVFVSRSEAGRLKEVLPVLAADGALTVGDSDGFAGQGGVIGFYLEANKVRFEINPAAARREGLKISSQLLSLGRLVPDGSGGSS